MQAWVKGPYFIERNIEVLLKDTPENYDVTHNMWASLKVTVLTDSKEAKDVFPS